MGYGDILEYCEDYGCVFELVKELVKRELGKMRRGIMLFLAPLPVNVGAYHVVGTNTIVMNSIILDALEKLGIDNLRKNSYIFTILLHEYLHSLGILDEREVRIKATWICRNTFGVDHLTTKMASEDPIKYVPEVVDFISSNVRSLRKEIASGRYEVVKDFDEEGARYFL